MKLQNPSSGQPPWTPSSPNCHAAARPWKRSFLVAPRHEHEKPRNEWSSYLLDTTLALAEADGGRGGRGLLQGADQLMRPDGVGEVRVEGLALRHSLGQTHIGLGDVSRR